jgi:serine/threonine protein kinase
MSTSGTIILTVLEPDGRKRRLEFKGYSNVLVGRDPQCDVVLPHPDVASNHLELVAQRTTLEVVNLRGRVAWLTGQRIEDGQLLVTGDRLGVGPYAILVESDSEQTVPIRPLTVPSSSDESFGRFILQERIGHGGMAEVFLAIDPDRAHPVALKRIKPVMLDDGDVLKMFHDEGRIVIQLDHQGLCRVLEVGSVNGEPYIAMEYVDGVDLRQIQRRQRPLSIAAAGCIVLQLCEALHYVHTFVDGEELLRNIVHRNVVPANVMLSQQGVVKLLDFGIARIEERLTNITPTGVLKGVLGYLAPEMVRGEPFDARVDVFATGVILYELCTGQRAFFGASDYAVLERLRHSELAPPRQLRPDISEGLEAVIWRSLDPDPDERFASAGELASALASALPEATQLSYEECAEEAFADR